MEKFKRNSNGKQFFFPKKETEYRICKCTFQWLWAYVHVSAWHLPWNWPFPHDEHLYPLFAYVTRAGAALEKSKQLPTGSDCSSRDAIPERGSLMQALKKAPSRWKEQLRKLEVIRIFGPFRLCSKAVTRNGLAGSLMCHPVIENEIRRHHSFISSIMD